MTRLLICCGDPSGDLYGSMLVRELSKKNPSLRVDAVGGPMIRDAIGTRGRLLFDLASLGITGFIEPLRKLATFARVERELDRRMREDRPDALICIDFYGFNRRVLSRARAAGVPAYYFVSPQVWASRPGRVKTLKSLVRRMLVIFPFERELYERAGIPVSWVGHPLLDILPPPRTSREPRSLSIGLLPGSRPSEIRRHLALFCKAADRILKDFPDTTLRLFTAPHMRDADYQPWISEAFGPRGARIETVRESDYTERSRLDFAITCSGTATLENALLGIPMVVVYRLSWPTYFLARALIRVPHIAMANLLAGKELVPELIQRNAVPKRLAETCLDLLGRPKRLEALRDDLIALRSTLGGPGACERAAKILLDDLAPRPSKMAAA